jgi:hypothetical protein
MTLENLKEYWKTVCLKHKQVREFQVGSDYDAAVNISNKYPLCFWEMPYSIQSNLSKPIDVVTTSFNVFIDTKLDDIKDSHEAISLAKELGDQIIQYVLLDTSKDFSLDSVNSISVREYSDDYVAGMRYDLVMTIKRDICIEDVNDYFN